MSIITPEAEARRLELCKRLTLERLMRDLTQRDIAAHFGDRQGNVQVIETGKRHSHMATFIAYAQALGLDVALVAEHHLPLLDLTADEVAALIRAGGWWADDMSTDDGDGPDPHLLSALDKLTTSTEETDR